MRQEWVQEDLAKKVIGTLKTYGFEYMKMDYNDTIGVGCDGAESLGEGLRQNMEGSLAFIRRVKKELPGIILENCSSGGHKLEPLMMSECSMASFSDETLAYAQTLCNLSICSSASILLILVLTVSLLFCITIYHSFGFIYQVIKLKNAIRFDTMFFG